MSHLTPLQLSSLLDGAISGAVHEHLTTHLSGCRECRAALPRLARIDEALRRLLATEPGEAQLEACAREMAEAIAEEARQALYPAIEANEDEDALLATVRLSAVPKPAAAPVPRPVARPAAKPAVAAAAPAELVEATEPDTPTEPRAVRAPIDWSARIAPLRVAAVRHARTLKLAAGSLAALAFVLFGSTLLPPVIRFTLPRLPEPRVPRIEVVTRGPVERVAPAPVSRVRAAALAPIETVVVQRNAPPPPAREPLAVKHAEPARNTLAMIPRKPQRSTPPVARPSDSAQGAGLAQRNTPARSGAIAPGESVPGDATRWPLLCGEVHDSSGAPVVGARVSLADVDLSARTDRRGHFCLSAPAGDRTLSVTAQGFATTRRLVSLVAQTLEISIELRDRE